jgi:hypothetical protein
MFLSRAQVVDFLQSLRVLAIEVRIGRGCLETLQVDEKREKGKGDTFTTCRQFSDGPGHQRSIFEVLHQDVCGLYRWLCAGHHALDYSNRRVRTYSWLATQSASSVRAFGWKSMMILA